MKVKSKDIIFLCAFILFLSVLNLSAQEKASYDVIQEFHLDFKNISNLYVANDTVVMFDKIERRIIYIDAKNRSVVTSHEIAEDAIVDITFYPPQDEIVALDNNLNILLGDLKNPSTTFYNVGNISWLLLHRNLSGKVKKICRTSSSLLFTTDEDWSSSIYKISNDFSHVDFFAYTRGIAPVALTFDGKRIWSLSKTNPNGTGLICRYDESGIVDIQFETSLKEPSAIYSDGQFLWLADSEEGTIYKIRVKSKEDEK